MLNHDTMRVPENLDKLSTDLWLAVSGNLDSAHELLKKQHVYSLFSDMVYMENPDAVDGKNPEQTEGKQLYGPYLMTLGDNSAFSFSIATASAQSGGKSTLINAILGFPVLVAAVTVTTACVTEIQYSGTPSIQVRYYGKEPGIYEDGPLLKGTDLPSEHLWQLLREFAVDCIRNKIICPETILYHSDVDWDNLVWQDIDMDRRDPRQVVQLYLVPLSMYVGQDRKSAKYEGILKKRAALLEMIGVNPKREYMLRVGWNHPVLKKGFQFVDLPGLGSGANGAVFEDGQSVRSHTDITLDYLKNANAIFLFFAPSALAGDIPAVLDTLLASESMRNVVSRENRITTILNMVDLVGNQGIPYSDNQIRSIMADSGLQPRVIYPMSAISGEYRFVESGITSIRRTQKYKKEVEFERQSFMRYFKRQPTPEELDQNILELLKNDYECQYEFQDIDGNKFAMNLPQWIQAMTTDYLDILRVMKALELMRMGTKVNSLLSEKIHAQIIVLEMMKKCGKELTGKLINGMSGKLKETVEELATSLSRLGSEISEKITRNADIASVRQEYLGAIQKIETDIAATLDNRANKMQANAVGNFILNPDEAVLPSAKQSARNNASQYDGMIADLKNYSLRRRIKPCEDAYRRMIQNVQRCYEDWTDGLIQVFTDLPTRITETLDQYYNEAKKGQGEQFERIFRDLYQKLRDSLMSQVREVSQIIIDFFRADQRVPDLQNETIDKVSGFAAELQNAYTKASQEYVQKLQSKAFVAKHAFNMSAFRQSVKEPFFKEQDRVQMVNYILEFFTDGYSNKISDTLSEIAADVHRLTNTGIMASINGMNQYIRQMIGVGGVQIDSEIVRLQGYLDNIINRYMRELREQTAPMLNALADYDWAKSEISDILGGDFPETARASATGSDRGDDAILDDDEA